MELFPDFGDGGRWLPVLRRHSEIIERERARVRVSSVAAEDVVGRQYAESLEIVRIAVSAAGEVGRVVDVGSGGGFPGMVMAAVLPGAEVVLVEPLRKRAALLGAAAEELGLTNVRVRAERGEEAGRGLLRGWADLVTARAVAELRELLEYTAPLAREGGLVALAKGSATAAEVEAADHALEELRCVLVGVESMRAEVSEFGRVVVVRKEGATPERYPRRTGIPGKRPL